MGYATQIENLIVAYANGQPSEVKIYGDAYVSDLGNFMPESCIIYINNAVVYDKNVEATVDFNPLLAMNSAAALEQRESFLKSVYYELIELGF